MTPLIGLLEFTDYAIIGVIVAAFTGGAALTRRQAISLDYLERQVKSLEKKLDALLRFHGIELPSPPPSGLSPEVERLAIDPSQLISAIKLYREENPGVGLAEAKKKIEDFTQTRK